MLFRKVLFLFFLIRFSFGSSYFQEEILEESFKHSLLEIKKSISIKQPLTCFISRVCEDDLWGSKIEEYLRTIGIQTIYDKNDLRGDNDIQLFIEKINSANFVITLFSPQYMVNYNKKTWIYRESCLIKDRLLRDSNKFHIPVLLSGNPQDSIPLQFFDFSRILYYSSTNNTDHSTDNNECRECIFRMLKEQIFLPDFVEGSSLSKEFDQSKKRFDLIKSKVMPLSCYPKELRSSKYFFPQSLITYDAFLDRTDKDNLSYLMRIFHELFITDGFITSSGKTTLCASGMGGVGKTTLAIEYAHKFGSFYDFVYWLDGESKHIFLNSCISLLDFLKISLPNQENRDSYLYLTLVIRLINEHLPKIKKHCLLIIDNVEDPTIVADLSLKNGHILYTSRNTDWLKKIDVDVLKRTESIKLLLKLSGLTTNECDEIDILAEKLGDLPLAIAQAAAYIKQEKLLNFSLYLDVYKANQEELLSKKQIQSSLNGKYGRECIVMTTWNTTMKKLSPSSQQIINCFAYLQSDIITKILFERLQDSLAELIRYSMIKDNGDSTTLSMHKLLQFVVRKKQDSASTIFIMDSLVKHFIRCFDQHDHLNPIFFEYGQLHIFSITHHIEAFIQKGDIKYDNMINIWIFLKMIDFQYIQKMRKQDSIQNGLWNEEDEGLSEIPPAERLQILRYLKEIVGDLDGQDLLIAVNTLYSIPVEERESFCSFLKRLIIPQMNSEQKRWLMAILEDVDSERREEFVEECQFAFEYSTEPETINTYIFTFADANGYLNNLQISSHQENDEEDNEESDEEGSSSNDLEIETFKPSNFFEVLGLSTETHPDLLTMFSNNSEINNQEFIALMQSFLTEDMDEGDRYWIVKVIGEMKKEDQIRFIEKIIERQPLTGWEKFFTVTSFYYIEKIEDKIFAIQKSHELLKLVDDNDFGKLIIHFDYPFIIKCMKDFFVLNNQLIGNDT
ncbi:MAG: hypothetical protein HEEMFOPI_01657 [Holosporales bacterium]